MARLLLLLLVAGCALAPTAAEPEIDGPMEVVIRQVLTNQIFIHAPEIPICYDKPEIAVTGEVVRRLHEGDPRVRPCMPKSLKSGNVWVNVRSVSKPRSDTYVIHAGYWCGLLCADDTEFTVQKRGGAWVITKSVFQWIS